MKASLCALLVFLALPGAHAETCNPKKRKNLRDRQKWKKCSVDKDCPQLKQLEFVCYEKECVPKDSLPDPVQCGPTLCAVGDVCCNESCGICVKPGGACTKQVCRPPQLEVRDEPKPEVSEPLKVECMVDKDCPPVNCIKAPCPSFVCNKEHQCILEQVEQCESDIECPNRDDKCVMGQCVRISILPFPPPDQGLLECEDRYDCPQVRCMAGVPCPTYECVDGECVAEYETFPLPPKENPECNTSRDCPQVDCLPGMPCPPFTCVDHQCVAEEIQVEVLPVEGIGCSEDFQCPQPTCLVGAPCPFFVCEEGECVANFHDEPEPVSCGPNVCKSGDVCCNASCGICTAPGSFCTQQACDFSYEKCNIDDDCRNEEDKCVEGKCAKPIQSLPSTPQCKTDFDCPQVDCLPGMPCPAYTCIDHQCVTEEIQVEVLPVDAIGCSEDFQCPQPTCLVGTPCPFFVCEEGECVAKYHDEPEPVSCGPNVCKSGDVCCNASCGICTAPGSFCTQQACDFSYEKCNVDDDCQNEEDKCVEGICTKPSTPQCKSDFECPQPRCAAGFPCPHFVCNGGMCIAEYNGPMIPTFSEVAEKEFVECEADKDCPKIACVAEPCPCAVCVDHKCTIREHA